MKFGFIHCTALLLSCSVFASPNVFIGETTCGLLDGRGNSTVAKDPQIKSEGSKHGGYVFKCAAKEVANTTGKQVTFHHGNTGLSCNTPEGNTEKWLEIIKTNGDVTLRCEVNPNN